MGLYIRVHLLLFPFVDKSLFSLSFFCLPATLHLSFWSLFFSPFPWLWSLSLLHTPPFPLHQSCSIRRSVFQWKPLINNNLHLKSNLILTTCTLFVNWISLLKDGSQGGGVWSWSCSNLCRCTVAAKPWPPRLNSSYTLKSTKMFLGNNEDFLTPFCSKTFFIFQTSFSCSLCAVSG